MTWEIILRDCTNVLTSAVSAFAQIPVPEALAIAGSADEHQRLRAASGSKLGPTMSVINRERNGYHTKKQRGGTQQPTGMIGAAA